MNKSKQHTKLYACELCETVESVDETVASFVCDVCAKKLKDGEQESEYRGILLDDYFN
jgi:hypothetical protein